MEITMFLCEYCKKKRYIHKCSAKRHEKECYWNPNYKACMTCQNYLNPDEITQFKVIGEDTVCVYAKENLFNRKCEGWRSFVAESEGE